MGEILNAGRRFTAARKEEQKAWARYLADTMKQEGQDYERVEMWAWQRLNERLKAISAEFSKK